MNSDKLKKNFAVNAILREEAEAIKLEQMAAVDDYGLLDDTGILRFMLKGHFDIKDFDGGPRLTLTYVKYMRFLDMNWVRERRKGLSIYNRIVFGRVYNYTYLKIREAYREALRGEIHHRVEEAIDVLNYYQ
jgi:hypothetical protein